MKLFFVTDGRACACSSVTGCGTLSCGGLRTAAVAWSAEHARHSFFMTLIFGQLKQSYATLQAGHALAAASEGVGVQQVGAFTLLLLPGAYVTLDSGALATLGPWRTLRVWRNFFCAVLIAALLGVLSNVGFCVRLCGSFSCVLLLASPSDTDAIFVFWRIDICKAFASVASHSVMHSTLGFNTILAIVRPLVATCACLLSWRAST